MHWSQDISPSQSNHFARPSGPGHPLYALPNVSVTPRYAGGPRFGALDKWKQIFDNCRAVLAGDAVDHSKVE